MINCPCGSEKKYAACCERYHQAIAIPETPEALMRSRFVAYYRGDMSYIQNTMSGPALLNFNPNVDDHVTWIKLQIIEVVHHEPSRGFVEFMATYLEGEWLKTLHEKSEFIREQGRWFYIDGLHLPVARPKYVARNNHCPCGSFKKFKHCHA